MQKTTIRRLKRHKKIVEKTRYFGLPRLAVFRSSKHIYASLVSEKDGRTIFSVSDKTLKNKNTKVENAKEVGKMFAEVATKQKVKKVIFDRGGYLYHGRVKALAEGARSGGLDF